MTDPFEAVFERLRAILEPYADRMYVIADGERNASDPAWGVAKREEHGIAYRRTMAEKN